MSLLEWYVPIGLLLVLLVILLRRGAYASHPFFFAYASFAAAAGLVRFAVRGNHYLYFLTYWSTEAGYDILGILAMYEAFRAALRSLARIKRTQVVFTFAGVLIFSVGMALLRTRSSASPIDTIPAFIVTGEIAVRFVQVIVFAGLVALVPLLGLRWRQHSFGISTGFGIYATVMLLTTTKFSDFGTKFKLLWAWTSLVAYSIAVLIWIWFFSVPQKTESRDPEISAPSPGDLQQYKDALRRMR